MGGLFIYFVIFLIILLEFVLLVNVCSFVRVFIAVFSWFFEKFKYGRLEHRALEDRALEYRTLEHRILEH